MHLHLSKARALTFLSLNVLSFQLMGQIEDFKQTNFLKADSIAQLYPRHSLQDIRGLAIKLTGQLNTDVEKFRAIYQWTCHNIENDYSLFIKNKEMREKLNPTELEKWNKNLNRIVLQTLVNNYRTVCTGYAYLIRELALHAGLSCVSIDGYGRTAQANVGGRGIPNHSWNAIQLNNKWYLCDATWSSGAIDLENKRFLKDYNDTYFLLDPSLFIRNHYPMNLEWALLKRSPSLDEFINGPLVYSHSFEYKIDSISPGVFNPTILKGEKIQFRFHQKGGPPISKAELRIWLMADFDSLTPNLKQEPGNFTVMEHTFKRRGPHVVHILFKSNYVFTYSVNVK